MILVDVYIPVLDKTCGFRLDETARVDDLTEELVEILCQHEQCDLDGRVGDLILCQFENHCILSRDSTLSQNGIVSGDRLALL